MNIPKLHFWIPAFNRFLLLSCLWLIIILLLRATDLFSIGNFPVAPGPLIANAMWADFLTFLSMVRWIAVPFVLLYMFVNRKAADIFYLLLISLYVLISFGLNLYFHQANVPLGADVFGYSVKDIKQTVGAAAGGLPVSTIIALAVVVVFSTAAIILFTRLQIRGDRRGFWFVLGCIILFRVPFSTSLTHNQLRSEYAANIALNKTGFFLTRAQQYFFSADQSALPDTSYVAAVQYPFLHNAGTDNVLAPYFQSANGRPPNIVIVLVEGLGRAFSGQDAYLGSFTPFLDSLSQHSLYWENFLSGGGRTFAVLPSLLGSLPFAKNGFAELAPQLPNSLTLLNIAKHNGYRTRFLYAGDAGFDKMDLFAKDQSIDTIIDKGNFGNGYELLPVNSGGFTWGYSDAALFSKYLDVTPSDTLQPRLDVMLTVSTHSPFMIPDQAYYDELAEKRIQALALSKEQQLEHLQYKTIYASVLYMDNALRNFFRALAARPDYQNTIVLITGDHRLPEIPMRSKLDRYHTMLMVHSPLLERAAKFSSVSSHLDVAPALTAYLGGFPGFRTPSLVTWIGNGLDTARAFRNIHHYPLMQTKNDLVDFVSGTWMLNSDNLFRILPNLDLEPVTDTEKLQQLKAGFNNFRQKNNQFLQTQQLIPDSLYKQFVP
ncbi:LTA synthase family protein [Chitinophaga niabensis]|uniref:LTA synthase family protein n=1 Tax=Chitinophaga niabensis TaxID=536979 RepID=UPI0031BBB182